ncbi:hypothetical protein [Mesorhizobium sp. M0898]|uniref:hypothetical protein n=1 Tax=Mesorhizobium sp. M0898 TaxID=2957020 RepID=UPI0033362C23
MLLLTVPLGSVFATMTGMALPVAAGVSVVAVVLILSYGPSRKTKSASVQVVCAVRVSTLTG